MASGEKNVVIKFKGETSDLDRAARKARRAVEKVNEGILKSVGDTANEIPSLLSTISESLPPQGTAIAIAITAGLAVALSSIIATALSSAVLLAVGGGVLGLGIWAAFNDPLVTKAFDSFKKKASKLFDDFGKLFAGPLARAFKLFGQVLDEIRPSVMAMGKAIAPLIDKLAPALAQFLRNMLPGIQKAVEASVPLWNTLADKLPLIGTAIGKFFDLISQNGDDTNQFVSDLITFIAGLIISLGYVISKLTAMYSAFRSFFKDVGRAMTTFALAVMDYFGMILNAAARAFGWIPGIGPKLKNAQREFADFRGKVNAELAKIHNRDIYVNVFSNVWSAIHDITKALQSIGAVSVGGKNIGRRALGGPVMAGRSYLVGENGPEVLTMGSNGYVTPNHALGAAGMGVLELTIDLGKGITERVSIDLREHDRQLKRTAAARGGR